MTIRKIALCIATVALYLICVYNAVAGQGMGPGPGVKAYAAGGGGGDWTPASVDFYEGAGEIIGSYKVLITDNSGAVLATTASLTHQHTNGYVNIPFTSATALSSSTAYRIAGAIDGEVNFKYTTGALSWSVSAQTGTLAAPGTPLDTCVLGDGSHGAYGPPLFKVKNAAGLVILQQSGTVAGESSIYIDTPGAAFTWCGAITSEATPQ